VTDGQTDRRTVALVDVGGAVTDGQTDGRTVALVDAGGLVTDGQTDRRTVALVDVGGLVTDGQTDRRTVALVDAGRAVMRRRSVAGTDEARELCLIRLVSASLAVLADLRHHVEERSRRTRHCNHTTSPHRPRGGRGETISPPPPIAVRRWHIVSSPIRPSWIQKSRRIYVRPRTGPQSAHLWWLAEDRLQAASVLIA